MQVVLRDDVFLLVQPAVSSSVLLIPALLSYVAQRKIKVRAWVLIHEINAGGGQLTCVADTKLVCDPTQQDRGRELCKATS